MPSLPIRMAAMLAVLLAAVMGPSMSCGEEVTELTLQLLAQEGSGQAGTAKLTAVEGRTEVVLRVNAGPAENDPQPVHVHFGSCGPSLGSVAYPLEDVVAGQSRTTVDVVLDSLDDGNHTINLHRSYPDVRIYTACGDIEKR